MPATPWRPCIVGIAIMAVMMTVVDAGLETDGSAREGRRTGLPRRADRALDRHVPAEVRERLPADPRRAGRTEVPAEEVQGSDHERRLRAAHAGAGTGSRHARGTRPTPGRGQQPGAARARRRPRDSTRLPAPPRPEPPSAASSASPARAPTTSIRLYKGRSHYNEWAFVYTAPAGARGGRRGRRAGWRRRHRGQRGQGQNPQPNSPFPRRPGWSSGTRRRARAVRSGWPWRTRPGWPAAHHSRSRPVQDADDSLTSS